MRCPVCKAAVEQGPACRRCRADLTLLFAVAAQSEAALAQARALACVGRYDEALAAADRAAALHATAATRRCRAALQLLRRDFAGAWRDLAPTEVSANT